MTRQDTEARPICQRTLQRTATHCNTVFQARQMCQKGRKYLEPAQENRPIYLE